MFKCSCRSLKLCSIEAELEPSHGPRLSELGMNSAPRESRFSSRSSYDASQPEILARSGEKDRWAGILGCLFGDRRIGMESEPGFSEGGNGVDLSLIHI